MTAEISGLLNLDKPAGLTSHEVVKRVRRVTGLRRIGHAGTLDPLATGVLLLGLGRATRLLEYLTGQAKTYETTIRLGQTTDSFDADGALVAEKPVTGVTRAAIESALAAFRGDIFQVPPMYSAVKQAGKPLYKLARQGIEVPRPARAVTIHTLSLSSWETPFLTLTVHCSSGTYIRTLAHDLGQALGPGGHVTALRRTAIGPFTLATGHPLAALTPETWHAALLPPDEAVRHLPALHLNQREVAALWQGRAIPTPAQPEADGPSRVYDDTGRFAGLVFWDAGVLRPHKMFPPIT